RAAMAQIREADLKRDLYALAGDAMRGREAGTLDEMRASMWIAAELEKIGVKPMGEDGTWFQWWNMRRTRISAPASTVTVADVSLPIWKEIIPMSNVAAPQHLTGSALVVEPRDTTVDVRGRVVVTTMVPP